MLSLPGWGDSAILLRISAESGDHFAELNGYPAKEPHLSAVRSKNSAKLL